MTNTCDVRPQADPEKLFDRFYRGDSARTQKSGRYGSGLSVVQVIVRSYGGKISVAYQGEHMIVFTVEL